MFFLVAVPEGFSLLPALVDAAKGGKWSLVVSLAIMALVWAATKAPLVQDWIKGEARIWVAAVAGMLAAFATSMFTSKMQMGVVDWFGAVSQGLSVGLAAGGLWSLVGRKFLDKKPLDANKDGVLDTD